MQLIFRAGFKDNFRNRRHKAALYSTRYVVLGRSARTNDTADYEYGDLFSKNSGKMLSFRCANGLVMEALNTEPMSLAEKQSGYSIELTRPTLNNVSPASWQLAQNFVMATMVHSATERWYKLIEFDD